MVLQYKCPDCGADLFYDANSKMLKCSSCSYTQDITLMSNENNQDGSNDGNIDPQALSDNVYEVNGDFEDFEEQSSYTTYSGSDAVHYVCQNCGAELITSADVTATTCSYCDAPMILGDRLSGDMAPALVLPFTISKEQAENAFRKWCKNGILTPDDFKRASRVKSLTGMYVPFWLYDINGRGEANFHATKSHSYRSGDYRITETKHYNIYRKVSLEFEKIPCDASTKMPDTMMDNLEPYSYNDLTNFQPAYLSGYIAEKYNYTAEQLFPRLKQKSDNYLNDYVRSTIQGYDSVSQTSSNYIAKQRNAHYTLLPVWMFAYNHRGKEYLFAMNGQTGAVVGKPPIQKSKVFLRWLLGTGISFLILYVITALGGKLL